MQCVHHAHWTGGAATFFSRLERVWPFLDGWFDKGQHFSGFSAQMLPFKCLARRSLGFLPKRLWHDRVPQSESVCLDCCAFTWPCASSEGAFRPHMEPNRRRVHLLFTCFAGCEIASNLCMKFCTLECRESNCANMPLLHTCSQCDRYNETGGSINEKGCLLQHSRHRCIYSVKGSHCTSSICSPTAQRNVVLFPPFPVCLCPVFNH